MQRQLQQQKQNTLNFKLKSQQLIKTILTGQICHENFSQQFKTYNLTQVQLFENELIKALQKTAEYVFELPHIKNHKKDLILDNVKKLYSKSNKSFQKFQQKQNRIIHHDLINYIENQLFVQFKKLKQMQRLKKQHKNLKRAYINIKQLKKRNAPKVCYKNFLNLVLNYQSTLQFYFGCRIKEILNVQACLTLETFINQANKFKENDDVQQQDQNVDEVSQKSFPSLQNSQNQSFSNSQKQSFSLDSIQSIKSSQRLAISETDSIYSQYRRRQIHFNIQDKKELIIKEEQLDKTNLKFIKSIWGLIFLIFITIIICFFTQPSGLNSFFYQQIQKGVKGTCYLLRVEIMMQKLNQQKQRRQILFFMFILGFAIYLLLQYHRKIFSFLKKYVININFISLQVRWLLLKRCFQNIKKGHKMFQEFNQLQKICIEFTIIFFLLIFFVFFILIRYFQYLLLWSKMITICSFVGLIIVHCIYSIWRNHFLSSKDLQKIIKLLTLNQRQERQ